MVTIPEEIGRITHERLAREAQAARIAKAAGAAGPGLAQRAVHNAGESFVSLGNWMKQVSLGEPAEDKFDIRFNI